MADTMYHPDDPVTGELEHELGNDLTGITEGVTGFVVVIMAILGGLATLIVLLALLVEGPNG